VAIDSAHTQRYALTSVTNSLAGLTQVMGRWRTKAACVGHDPELFFPIGTTGPALDQIKRAKEVCARCQVRQQCLEWALDTRQAAGIWGGLDEEARRTLHRNRRRARRWTTGKASGERP
jgi:WhiB family redox-sensing transcriptional regulator